MPRPPYFLCMKLHSVPEMESADVGSKRFDYASSDTNDTRTKFDPLDGSFIEANAHLKVKESVRVPEGGKVLLYEGQDAEFIGYVNLSTEIRKQLGLATSTHRDHAMGFAQMTGQIRDWLDHHLRVVK